MCEEKPKNSHAIAYCYYYTSFLQKTKQNFIWVKFMFPHFYFFCSEVKGATNFYQICSHVLSGVFRREGMVQTGEFVDTAQISGIF